MSQRWTCIHLCI